MTIKSQIGESQFRYPDASIIIEQKDGYVGMYAACGGIKSPLGRYSTMDRAMCILAAMNANYYNGNTVFVMPK